MNIKFYFLVLTTFVFLLPGFLHADGLFDFQMKLAKKGNAEAEYKVGEMYETGFGVKKDMTEAMDWIKRSANQGHETASFKLLYWDVKKNGLTDTNKAEFEALNEKAKTGNAQAQYYVGKMYANGIGVKKNANSAISWLNKAALVGVLAAESELIVVRENKQRAVLSKRRAEEKSRARLQAKQEREKQAKLENQRKLQAKKQAEVKAKAQADAIAKKNQAANAAEAKADADRLAAAEEAEQANVLAQKQADARKREAQKQALIKQRAAEEKKRKTQFESDPCSGKSARFLSTCK